MEGEQEAEKREEKVEKTPDESNEKDLLPRPIKQHPSTVSS